MTLDPNPGVATPQPYAEAFDPSVPEPVTILVPTPEAKPTPKRRRAWIGMVAIGCIGAIAAGTLGYLLYTATGQRDDALRAVDETQSALASTQAALKTTQQDLAARRAVITYAAIYAADSGNVRIEYAKLAGCSSFGSCRTSAQSLLSNLQIFQADRAAAVIPPGLAESDAMLRDGLSAAIAAVQSLISGMDNANRARFEAGWKKLTAAMLSVAKAEAALGAELK